MLIGLLSCHAEADQGDDGRAHVGEVVEGVSHDRDRSADRAREHFDAEKQDVQNNPHNSAKSAVSTAHGGRRGIRGVLNKDF